LGSVIWTGVRYGVRWNSKVFLSWGIYLVWIVLVIFGPRWNLSVLIQVIGSIVGMGGFGAWMGTHVPRWLQLFVFFVLPLCGWLFAHGIRTWIDLKKYQRALDHLGLKTPTGISPKVVRVVELENKQRRILVHAVGLDVAQFRDKKGALESSFNAIVQEVRVTPANRQMVEILVSDRELPTLVRFDDRADSLRKPYTFLVGETMDGFITADLCEIHHMLVAGATGGGKSVFFKQALVGILKTSRHIQLYLVDLKRGVEFKVFDALDNVVVAKDEPAALSVLQAVVAEMERRFRFLEENGFNEISPERDGLDRIVVAIDEASELFIIEKSSKEAKVLAQGARELTDKIAKLGRAAGIHLILATQKVVKETIDTRVQTNINAKMCFRVNTIASSMTVLNNKKAADLPKINGRGIWSVGSSDIVVQVPYLDTDGIAEEVESLTVKFNGDASPLKQKMLQLTAPKNDQPNTLIVSSEDNVWSIKKKGDA
jgi:DNA segregation ATPase FtsK/SpoIIIE-like protein